MAPWTRRALIAAGLLTPMWAPPSLAASGSAPVLRFPRDHGSHNDTRTEWWYLTGHAQDRTGRRFGFQLTFFRSRVDAAQSLPGRLAARQLLIVHAAITDVQTGRLQHEQRMARWNGAEPEAGRRPAAWASQQDLQLELGKHHLRRRADGAYEARFDTEPLGIELAVQPQQAILLQGDGGLSRKGPLPENTSHYISHPQLQVSGDLRLQGQVWSVQGLAWLDHEWSDAMLPPDAVGWDWFGMNLDGGHALTAFRLRRQDGSALWTGGSFRSASAAGSSHDIYRFQPGEVDFVPQRHWTSPHSGARYPVEWRVRTPADFYTVKAVVDPQELDARQSTGTVYWEGLSELHDSGGRRVGRGYLEMTGYAQRLVL